MIFLKIILLVVMLYIAYEDFRFRAISLYSIVVFLIAAVSYSFLLQGIQPAVYSTLWNLAIAGVQLAVTYLYFRFIKKQREGFVNNTLGVGDLLFYIPVLFLFSPLNFIIIHILSLFIVLVAFVIYKSFYKPLSTVPLAGGLSVIMLAALVSSWLYLPAALYDDMFIADLLYSLSL